MNQTEKIISILIKRLTLGLSPEEEKDLESWAAENPEIRNELLTSLSDTSQLGEDWRKRTLIDSSRVQKEMAERLGLSRKRRLGWFTAGISLISGAAACLIVLLAPSNNNRTDSTHANAGMAKVLSIDSIHAGQNIAFVNVGGTKISLSEPSTSAGTPVASLRKKVSDKGPVVLEVPRGGEFIVVLEDSTKVWLNSASTLTYPENFGSSDRRVEVSGEAYFSVTKKDDGKPFYVSTSGQQICVYGTEFNVRSYPEEDVVLTTLKSGSVGLRRADGRGGEVKLSPGKQSVFDKSELKASVREVDVDIVTGWRHGRFVFQDQTLKQIMYDLGRWYDFEFDFADSSLANLEFMGSIPRYSDFSTAMMILEKTGGITFRVKDNKIIVDKKNKKQ